MTPEEYQRLQDRVKNRTAMARSKKAKRNKYGAIQTEIDGITFDSKAEGARYLQLKTLQRAGEISGLQTQVRFNLLPAQEVGGRKERPVDYIADFQYQDKSGAVVVEDAKSAPTKTKEFVLKRKLMMFFHGIVVREVMVDG